MTDRVIQIQLFGKGNTQVLKQEISRSLPALLNQAEGMLKQRNFTSAEVKERYLENIRLIIKQINDGKDELLEVTKYVIFPFQTLAEDEILKDETFLNEIVDSLSLMFFSNIDITLEKDYLNASVNKKNIYGVYFRKGRYDLKDNFIQLLEELTAQKVPLPSNFCCMIMNCCVGDFKLDEEKIKRIVTNITGNDSYIKRLDLGQMKCFSPTSYIVKECQSISEAITFVRGYLNVGD